MAYSTITLANIYKKLYPEGIEHLVLAESPTLGLMPKWAKMFGDGKELAWRVNNGGQVSASFSVAQARTGQSTINKPLIKRKALYITKTLDHESLEAAENNSGALVDLVEEATNNAMDELKRTAGQLIIGDKYNGSATGAIGRISAGSNVGTATITLDDPTMINNFYPGQTLCAFDAPANALRSAGAVVTVSSIDEEAGTITATGNWSAGIAAVAASDYIVPEGNYKAVQAGMFAWNPATLIAAGAGDSFFTVDRGGSIAMQGCRYAPAAGSVDEVLIAALHLHDAHGGRNDTTIMNPIDFGNLIQQSNTLQRINENAVGSNGKKIADLSFEGIVLNGPRGKVAVYSDPYMPRYKAKIYKRSDFRILTMKEMFRLLVKGANSEGMVRTSNADSSELRFGGYWNTALDCPRNMMDVTIPA
jgi:hypothetical protein